MIHNRANFTMFWAHELGTTPDQVLSLNDECFAKKSHAIGKALRHNNCNIFLDQT